MNTFAIYFGQPILGDFSANVANNPADYTIAGQASPTDTSIVINGTCDGATIVLPAEFVAKTDPNEVFTVNNV